MSVLQRLKSVFLEFKSNRNAHPLFDHFTDYGTFLNVGIGLISGI